MSVPSSRSFFQNLEKIWKQAFENVELHTFPNAWHNLWHFGSTDTCGGADPAWICVEEVTGRIIQITPGFKRSTYLIANSIEQFYNCLIDMRLWYEEFNGNLLKGNSVIAICRILSQPHFSNVDTRWFWFPASDEILNGDFVHENANFPGKQTIKFT